MFPWKTKRVRIAASNAVVKATRPWLTRSGHVMKPAATVARPAASVSGKIWDCWPADDCVPLPTFRDGSVKWTSNENSHF